MAAWTDTRLGDQANGRQDVFATSVVGLGSSNVSPWLLVVGLVLVAAVVAWCIASRSIGSEGRHQP